MGDRAATPAAIDETALARLMAEYSEMPGLRLTARQAERLMGLTTAQAERLLDRLVQTSFLFRSGDGRYGRLTDGPALPLPNAASLPRAQLGRPAKSNVA
jgi:hypothetical protein